MADNKFALKVMCPDRTFFEGEAETYLSKVRLDTYRLSAIAHFFTSFSLYFK